MDELSNLSYEQQPMNSGLVISYHSIEYLKEIAKWTKFLSIIGFIMIGIMILMGLGASTIMSTLPFNEFDHLPTGIGVFYGMMYVVIAIIYFFPTWYLFNYSKKLKSAIVNNNNEELELAFSNQKSLFKFMGISAIVILAIYALIIVALLFMFSAMM